MKFTFPPESRPLDGFTLKRAIYRGGFGEVYYGLSDAGREVALKLLQHNTDIELRGVQQCLNLSHPNLVTIFDVRQDGDGDHWIVMEYVSGETLEAAIRRHPAGMPVETVRKWLPGIVAGISFLHSRGLVHRDLKPGNVFIENDVVKVGDVGLSKFIAPSRQSAHTQSVGTVYYMAPEVAKGRYGKAVDIYALGIILFEMLTGELPFDGESTGEILMKHLTEKPDLSKLPPRLKKVVARALQKDPQERFASGDELLVAFDAAVLGRSHSDSYSTEPVCPEKLEESRVQGFQRDEEMAEASHLERRRKRRSREVSWNKRNRVGPIIVSHLFAIPLAYCLYPSSNAWAMCLAGGVGVSLIGLFHWSPKRNATEIAAMGMLPRADVKSTKILLAQNQTRNLRIGSVCSASVLTVPFTILLAGMLAAMRPSLFAISGSGAVDPGLLGFFMCVAVLASWGLVFSPVFQSRKQKEHFSRWGYAAVGGLVGIAAWKLDQFLLVDLPMSGEFLQSRALFHQLGELPLVNGTTGPTLAGYFAFFATLLAIGRWNKLTSPDRSQRFSVGAVFGAVVIAWLTTKVFEFPTAWALAWGAVIACSVQLSSPWNDRPKPRFIDHSK